MTKANHTPGPWWPVQCSSGWSVRTYRDNSDDPKGDADMRWEYGAYIAISIGDHTENRTSGNEEANARLIAAAPDLLDALDDLLTEAAEIAEILAAIGKLPPKWAADNAVCHKAKAAITKARGEA